ncbi:hypothetical protein BGZ61DRAFT_479408 [Ilyonectria robusta]|uniref:uncharacterized protein n=1 Tax=Ilyonectria robusta TaxID=1079257 RepID=UPI001E8EC2F4|nr:uncharacterized protein BGZ61DRAFT_479408 [Ilyonectria robusta]KAH8686297.1 hypothetical protein BGZ61DRAFT_479408 [Ilyonectria robusta]
MKFFALLSGLALAAALPSQPDSEALSLRSEPSILHDLVLNVTSFPEQNEVLIDYLYKPGVDFYQEMGFSADTSLARRTDVNIPGIGERISVAFRIATVTIIRAAADVLRVEIDNLVNYTITVTLNWATGTEEEKVPGSATVKESITIPDRNGQIRVTASRFS